MRNRCIACLEVGHLIKNCSSRRKCYYCGTDAHNSALCKQQFSSLGSSGSASRQGSGFTGSKGPPTANGTSPPSSSSGPALSPGAKPFTPTTGDSSGLANFFLVDSSYFSLLKSAKAVVAGEHQAASAQFLFDDGSTLSFITQEAVQKIGAKSISVKSTAITRFGESCRASANFKSYLVNVRMPNGLFKPIVLHETSNICAPMQIVPMDTAQFPFILDMPHAQPLVAEPTMAKVDILIGLDYYYDFLGSEHRRLSNGVVFLNSLLGFVASGMVSNLHRAPVVAHDTQMLTLSAGPPPDFDLQKFLELENVRIQKESKLSGDEYAQKHFDSHVSYSDGRYFACWLYKYDSPPLADNFDLAFSRLRSSVKRLQGEPPVLDQYTSILQEQIDRKIIEKAPDNPDGLVYYMPHHAVFKPKGATTKIRVVYDASAKSSKDGYSLNDCLLRGPVILSDLVGSILRFRINPIAFISDIEKAFHMVGLSLQDRDVTRFLWLKNPRDSVSVDNFVTYRFCRVPFGTVASSFLLAATIVHHLKNSGSSVASDILDNTYVDNVLGGAPDQDHAMNYYREAKQLFSSAAMNLRQWFLNCPEFNVAIDSTDFGQTQHTSDLGLQWDTTNDNFICTSSLLASDSQLSKREILSALAALFDPCGWFSPTTTACRVLMQEIWKDGFDWDVRLPEELLKRWQVLCSDLLMIPSLALPRYLGIQPKQSLQLHCFADASSRAYAAAVYLSVQSLVDNIVSCHLLCARSKVAPLKSCNHSAP